MNKGLAKFLIYSTVALTGIMGLWLAISLFTSRQTNITQEVKSSFSDLTSIEAKEFIQQSIELYQQGKYSEAIPLAEQALAIIRKQLGDNHPDTATSLNNLAVLYQDLRTSLLLGEFYSFWRLDSNGLF